MRRRDLHATVAVPERLARFLPSEWPGTIHAAYESWRDAREEWAEQNPGPLGDFCDQLLYARAERKRLAAVFAAVPESRRDYWGEDR